MAEYHLMGGDLMLAINQLELALSVPSITDQQRAKFVARLKEVREWLPKERNRSKQPQDGERSPDSQRSPGISPIMKNGTSGMHTAAAIMSSPRLCGPIPLSLRRSTRALRAT